MFKKAYFLADELVEIQVFLRSSAPLNLSLSKLSILFVNEVCTDLIIMCVYMSTDQ